MIRRPLIFILALGLALSLGTLAQARDLTILAPTLPPNFNDDGSGREAEIIRETLKLGGHGVNFQLVPFTRNWAEFKAGTGDAVATVPAGNGLGGQPSVDYIRYQNGASVLAASGLSVAKLDDLAGHSAVTFAGGKEILPGLKAFEPKLGSLREQTEQLIHSNLLFAKRVDAVLGDGIIFAEYNRQLQEQRRSGKELGFDPTQPVSFSAIFPPTPYHLEFRDPAVRDDFNRAFAQLTADGTIDRINRQWIERYRATVHQQYLGY